MRTAATTSASDNDARPVARWDPLAALEFLTIIRLHRFRPVSAETLARAQVFYPLVGLLLGGILVGADWLLGYGLPAGPRGVLLLALLALLTCGLHLDGLADTFDGLLGGQERERRLAIMRDPRIGSFGVTALVLTLLLKWSALASLLAADEWRAVLLGPLLGRCAIVALAAAVPYARPDGLGSGFHAAARGLPVVVAAIAALVGALLVGGVPGLALLAATVLTPLLLGWWSQRAIGGATGDLYGAACELTEAAVWLVAVALSGAGG